MKREIKFVRATIIGGLLFLVPIATLLIIVGKLVVVLRSFARKAAPFLPVDTFEGLVLMNVLALAVVVGGCFLAGLAARTALVKGWGQKLEESLLVAIPGYSFVKGFADSMKESDELADSFLPVAVRLDDYFQIAFEIERKGDHFVVVYLPGAPNPWSGTVAYFTPDRVRRLDMSVGAAVRNLHALGKGSARYVDLHGKVFPEKPSS